MAFRPPQWPSEAFHNIRFRTDEPSAPALTDQANPLVAQITAQSGPLLDHRLNFCGQVHQCKGLRENLHAGIQPAVA